MCLDQEGKIIAEILRSYRDLVNFATEPITNKSSTGQASYNSMAMDLETQNLVRALLYHLVERLINIPSDQSSREPTLPYTTDP